MDDYTDHMERSYFEILTFSGNRFGVEAFVSASGLIAIHESRNGIIPEFNPNPVRGFSITHVLTGCRIVGVSNLAIARKFTYELEDGYDWSFVSKLAIPDGLKDHVDRLRLKYRIYITT